MIFSSLIEAGQLPLNIWQQTMMVRDRISKDDNKILDLLGFSMSSGDVLIVFDQVNRQIVSISGSLHNVDNGMFKTLQTRFNQKPLEGWSIQEDIDAYDGEADPTIKLDLKNLALSYSDEFLWIIKNSESLDLKLLLQGTEKNPTLSLEMNVGDSMNPKQTSMLLVDDIKI